VNYSTTLYCQIVVEGLVVRGGERERERERERESR